MWDSDHSKSQWRTNAASADCRNSMGAQRLQQQLPPSGIDAARDALPVAHLSLGLLQVAINGPLFFAAGQARPLSCISCNSPGSDAAGA